MMHVSSSRLALHARRLSAASARNRCDIFLAVPWDDHGDQLDLTDQRWSLPRWDPLAATSWHQGLDADARAVIGLLRAVSVAAAGIEFERVLTHGLLGIVAALPREDPAHRFLYHEISEEAQHSLMFRELVVRSGIEPPRRSDDELALLEKLGRLGPDFPALFFLTALAGEEALDFLQRRTIEDHATHPLLARICTVHVADEARHVSFARAFLTEVVPQLSDRERRRLQYQAPFVVSWTLDLLLQVPDAVCLATGEEIVPVGPPDPDASRQLRIAAARRVVDLSRTLGILDVWMEPTWGRSGLVRGLFDAAVLD